MSKGIFFVSSLSLSLTRIFTMCSLRGLENDVQWWRINLHSLKNMSTDSIRPKRAASWIRNLFDSSCCDLWTIRGQFSYFFAHSRRESGMPNGSKQQAKKWWQESFFNWENVSISLLQCKQHSPISSRLHSSSALDDNDNFDVDTRSKANVKSVNHFSTLPKDSLVSASYLAARSTHFKIPMKSYHGSAESEQSERETIPVTKQ